MAQKISRDKSTVTVYCKGAGAHKTFDTEEEAIAAAHRLRTCEDEEELYEATADWELDD